MKQLPGSEIQLLYSEFCTVSCESHPETFRSVQTFSELSQNNWHQKAAPDRRTPVCERSMTRPAAYPSWLCPLSTKLKPRSLWRQKVFSLTRSKNQKIPSLLLTAVHSTGLPSFRKASRRREDKESLRGLWSNAAQRTQRREAMHLQETKVKPNLLL